MDYTKYENIERKIRDEKRGKYREVRKSERRLVKILAVLLIIMLAWCYREVVVKYLVDYQTAKWGVLERKIPVQAVIIRVEKVISSPATGKFVPKVKEGEKVPAQTVVGYVHTQSSTAQVDRIKVPVKAPWAGLVSFCPDNLETVLKPDILNNMDMDKVSSLLKNQLISKSQINGNVNQGEPVIKIVDNLANPCFFFKLPANIISPLPSMGKNMYIQVTGTKKRLSAKVLDVRINGEEAFFMVEINDIQDWDLSKRFYTLDIIPEIHEGVVVPQKALVQKDGVTYIFISYQGVAKLVKVNVDGMIGDEAVVHGLEVGQRYISNSSFVKEGYRLD